MSSTPQESCMRVFRCKFYRASRTIVLISAVTVISVASFAQASATEKVTARSPDQLRHLFSVGPGLGVAPPSAPRDASLRTKAKYDVNRIGSRDIGKGLNFYSVEAERALGRSLADDVDAHSRLIRDAQISRYMEHLVFRLVVHSDARSSMTVKIVDNSEINAFALPGGYLYVNSGLILSSEDEAELAAMIAHKVVHVAARNAGRNATRMQLLNLASLPLVYVGGPAGMALQQLRG